MIVHGGQMHSVLLTDTDWISQLVPELIFPAIPCQPETLNFLPFFPISLSLVSYILATENCCHVDISHKNF